MLLRETWLIACHARGTITAMKPKFFATPAGFRLWLEKHHATSTELLVGLYKKGCGKPSITWPEAVDEALCFGWIDGVRRSLDERSYVIRFTPRKPDSNWSAVNLKRAQHLAEAGRMHAAGLKTFQNRKNKKAGYSYEERKAIHLAGQYEQHLRANTKAWSFFQAQAPWYRRTAAFWVMSAKKEETRQRRLATLIQDSEDGRIAAEKTPGC
jgi:uncharacterized protein YdeI (YjbR/CyaY-like superfamily)